MFCKFCGKQIREGSIFCSECGRKLKREESTKTKEHVARPSLLVILIIPGLIFIYSMIGMRGGLDNIILRAIRGSGLILGLVVLSICIILGNIKLSNYRNSDVLALIFVWLIIPKLIWRAETNYIFNYMGLTAYEAVIEGYSIEMVSQMSSFWVLMGVTLLGLERTDEWKPTKKVFAVLLVVLALRSVLMYQSFDFFESIVSHPVDVEVLLKPYCNVIFTFFWLWPMAVILTFGYLGADKISAIAASISFLGMALGEILMTIFFVIFLRYGVTGLAFARGLAPIISILITIFASRTVKTI